MAQLCCVCVPVPAPALPRLMEQSIRGRSLRHCLAVLPQPSGSQSPQLILPQRGPPTSLCNPVPFWAPCGHGEHESAPSLLSLPQGCFSTFGRTLQRYISLPGTCSLAVLGIEVMRGAGDRTGRVSTLYGRGIVQWAGKTQRGSGLS